MRTALLVPLILASCLLPASSQAIRTEPLKTPRARREYRQILNKLVSLRLTVSWKDMTIGEVVADLRRRVGLNVLVARPLQGRAGDPAVDLGLSRVRALTVMRIAAEQNGFVFQNRGGILWATTAEDAVRRSIVLGIHNVRDILYVPPDFPAPRILGIEPGRRDGGFGGFEDELEREPSSMDPEQVVDLVRSATGEKTWEHEGVSIGYMNGRIVVRHSPGVQARVARLLNRLRGAF